MLPLDCTLRGLSMNLHNVFEDYETFEYRDVVCEYKVLSISYTKVHVYLDVKVYVYPYISIFLKVESEINIT